jgi:hypothetical protein
MSTLQHTPKQALSIGSHSHLAIAALLALTATAAITITLIASGGNSSSIGVSGLGTGVIHGTPRQELQVVSGPRYGLARPSASPAAAHQDETASPTQAQRAKQLQAVAGARYLQPHRSGHGATLREIR